jgi:hypothetical protein
MNYFFQYIFKVSYTVMLREVQLSCQRTLLLSDFFLHCKKRFMTFPSPAGMSLTKLSLAGNNLILPGQGEFGK